MAKIRSEAAISGEFEELDIRRRSTSCRQKVGFTKVQQKALKRWHFFQTSRCTTTTASQLKSKQPGRTPMFEVQKRLMLRNCHFTMPTPSYTYANCCRGCVGPPRMKHWYDEILDLGISRASPSKSTMIAARKQATLRQPSQSRWNIGPSSLDWRMFTNET